MSGRRLFHVKQSRSRVKKVWSCVPNRLPGTEICLRTPLLFAIRRSYADGFGFFLNPYAEVRSRMPKRTLLNSRTNSAAYARYSPDFSGKRGEKLLVLWSVAPQAKILSGDCPDCRREFRSARKAVDLRRARRRSKRLRSKRDGGFNGDGLFSAGRVLVRSIGTYRTVEL